MSDSPPQPLASSDPSNRPIHWADPAREVAFHRWLDRLVPEFGLHPHTVSAASADASFRRYLRIDSEGGTRIIMDAPPPLEDVRPFVHVAGLLEQAGLLGPRILSCDADQGFLLTTDLGRELYLHALRQGPDDRVDALMRAAIAALVQWQQRVPAMSLPPYDETALRAELDLFPAWCVEREHGLSWTAAQQDTWQRVCRTLIDSALAQPTVAVHRDWMPRNLMVCEGGPGILDFQDAVRGPISYDVASMVRDAFWSWDEAREIDWTVRYWEAARQAGLPVAEDFGEFWRQVEWMGLQRHLKILGIFCRLKHRDGKAHYATDLPRFFTYATRVALRYRELKPLLALLEPMSGAAVKEGLTF